MREAFRRPSVALVAAALVAAASVCCAAAVGDGDASAPGAHAARSAAPEPPRRASTSLRLMIRPIGASSSSISICFLIVV